MIGYAPKEYHKEAIQFCLKRLAFTDDVAGAGLLLDPGLGKTGITLSVLEYLLAMGVVEGALVVAPKTVCDTTWVDEPVKWRSSVTFKRCSGTQAQRLKTLACRQDVLIVNPETVPWLQKNFHLCDRRRDMLILDESTKFKNWTAVRTKALRKMLPGFSKRMILTGTPTPNGYQDLFSQAYMLDDGEALGKTLGVFRSRFMRKGGFLGKGWAFRGSQKDQFEAAISHLVLRQDALDHLDIPPLTLREVPVILPPDVKQEYDTLEKKLFMSLGEEEIIASSAGSKYAMCRGVANGGVYVTEGDHREERYVHKAKVDALAELVDELPGRPLLVAYQYNHDLHRIQERFPEAPCIRGGTKGVADIVRDWNKGAIPMLLVQPQALSHGVNMQAGGRDVVWFGLSDQLEVYQQFNARVHRQGTTGHVTIHHLLARGTVDELMHKRVSDKAEGQRSLLASLKTYAATKTHGGE